MPKFTTDLMRRSFLGKLILGSSVLALAGKAAAANNENQAGVEDELKFPGEDPAHKVVYQFNKASEDYHKDVLFSVGAMLRKYGDNIKIVVTCFGPGIHVLAKHPKRPVSKETREKISSLAVYGVEFHACGNTMKSLKWTKKDMLDLATVVDVGAADMMELQEKGYAYLSW